MKEPASNSNKQKISRRKFLGLGAAAFLGGIAVGGTYLYINDESKEPVVEKVQIPIRALPESLEGFTIAILSDFHLYPLTQLPLIETAVAMTNALNPDLTVLLGDYVWHEVEAIFDLAPALGKLNARHGVYSIMGNHDLWTNVDIITAGLEEAHLPILRNKGIPIPAGKESLYLAGLDDGWAGNPDLALTLANRKADATTVLLMHEPDLADKYALDDSIALQLSGHSHGGQIRFPYVGAIILPYLAWKYDMGLYKVKDLWLYTNRGLGVTNEPFRYNCAPEITEITLVRA